MLHLRDVSHFDYCAACSSNYCPIGPEREAEKQNTGGCLRQFSAAEWGGGVSCCNNKANNHQDACLPWRSVSVWV